MVPPPEHLVSSEIEYIPFKSALFEFTDRINDGGCIQESSTCALNPSVFTHTILVPILMAWTILVRDCARLFLATSMEKKNHASHI